MNYFKNQVYFKYAYLKKNKRFKVFLKYMSTLWYDICSYFITKKHIPTTGEGIVVKIAPNFPITAKTIMITAPTCMTSLLPTYKTQI